MLVSAFLGGGPPRRVIEEARDGRIALVVPELAIEELIRVLGGKLGAERDAVVGYVEALREIAAVAPSPAGPEVTGDAADDAILACAASAEAEVLVTGDRRHLLPVEWHRGVRIVSPQALLAELPATPREPPAP